MRAIYKPAECNEKTDKQYNHLSQIKYNSHHVLLKNKIGFKVMSKLLSYSFGCFIVLGSFSTTSFATEYYKWVDSKGSTHYTKTPPPASVKKKTKVDTYGWNNSAPYKANTTEETPVASDAEKVAQATADAAASQSQPAQTQQMPSSDLPK